MNYLSNVVLSLQGTAAFLSLIGALIVVSVVILVIKSTSKPIEGDYHAAKEQVYKLQKPYFIGLAAIIVAVFAYSFQFLPYYADKTESDIDVAVAGVMFSWKMAEGDFGEDINEFRGNGKITLPVDKKINFTVSSIDVTHNFAIYDEDGNTVAQTQAMPMYGNKLAYTFPKEGTYVVACFEYCGLGHSLMVGEINVKSEAEYIEDKEYEEVKSSSEIEDWKAFLEKYPNGQYVEKVEKKIKRMNKKLQKEVEEVVEEVEEVVEEVIEDINATEE